MAMDNMDRIRREDDRRYEGTKTTLGVTGMIILTLVLMVVLGLIAIWVL